MHEKRISAITSAVEALQPRYYFPYSADFTLNGPASKPFYRYVQNAFMDRREAAQAYKLGPESCTRIPKSEYLNPSDELILSKDDIKIDRNLYSYTVTKPSTQRLPINPTSEISRDDIIQAFRGIKLRASRFKVNLEDSAEWHLIIATELNRVAFSFANLDSCAEEKALRGKYLEIRLSEALLGSLLTRKLHWANCMIGYHLTNKRVPNEYCESVYKALNFFHL